jgi:hypothetical protein
LLAAGADPNMLDEVSQLKHPLQSHFIFASQVLLILLLPIATLGPE